MYVYLITNKINNKKYVGITNDYKKRWYNHKSKSSNSVISKAIQKYGAENFTFEIIEENVLPEDIEEKEIYYIKYFNSLIENGQGYNVATGGYYNFGETGNTSGTKNGRALLTEEQVRYIKSHRNLPEMVLYEEFSDIITYSAFKNVYLHKTYLDIEPTVDIYPYNFEMSCQFNQSKLTYGEVKELREQYNNKVFWRDAYTEKYQQLYPNEYDFWNIYYGNRYSLVMPEVFTEENRKFQASYGKRGERNSKAKLTWKDVNLIRELFETKEKTLKELYQMYPQVTPNTIRDILHYKTWKK